MYTSFRIWYHTPPVTRKYTVSRTHLHTNTHTVSLWLEQRSRKKKKKFSGKNVGNWWVMCPPPLFRVFYGCIHILKVYSCVYTKLLALQARLCMCTCVHILCVLLCEVCPPPPLDYPSSLYVHICIWICTRVCPWNGWHCMRCCTCIHACLCECLCVVQPNNTLQHTAIYCNVLQYTVTHCSIHTTEPCNTHTHVAQPSGTHHIAMHNNTLYSHTIHAISMSRSCLERAWKSRERVVWNSGLDFDIQVSI